MKHNCLFQVVNHRQVKVLAVNNFFNVKKKLTQESTNTLVECKKVANERCYSYSLLPEARKKRTGSNLRKTAYIKTALRITLSTCCSAHAQVAWKIVFVTQNNLSSLVKPHLYQVQTILTLKTIWTWTLWAVKHLSWCQQDNLLYFIGHVSSDTFLKLVR